MSAHGFVCGEFVGVAHFNSELPKVSAFLRTAFLDQLPRRFGACLCFPQTSWLPWQGGPGFRILSFDCLFLFLFLLPSNEFTACLWEIKVIHYTVVSPSLQQG